MVSVTPSMVKALRERTGAGLMDCKQALAANEGGMEAAIDWLRQKGRVKAASKAARTAGEGVIALAIKGNQGALLELNSETDFVSRNKVFREAAVSLAQLALTHEDSESLKQAAHPSGEKVEQYLTGLAAKLGENIILRRLARLSVSKGVLGGYIHGGEGGDCGRIGVLAALEGAGEGEKSLARQIAMHIAASNPLAVRAEDIDASLLERERTVLEAQAREEGKPENIISKMVEGRLARFRKENVLLDQAFIVDEDKSVSQAIKQAGVSVSGFVRLASGEETDDKTG